MHGGERRHTARHEINDTEHNTDTKQLPFPFPFLFPFLSSVRQRDLTYSVLRDAEQSTPQTRTAPHRTCCSR